MSFLELFKLSYLFTNIHVIDKNELEQKKLELEIKELAKPWYRKSNYLSVIPTMLLAAFTIILSLRTGLFDVKNENLKLERYILTIEITDFQHRRELTTSQQADEVYIEIFILFAASCGEYNPLDPSTTLGISSTK